MKAWYRSWNSPYYNASHQAFRTKVREFTEKEIMPFCHEWDEAKTLPKELFEKASAAGWLPVCVGTWPTVRSQHLCSAPKCGGGRLTHTLPGARRRMSASRLLS